MRLTEYHLTRGAKRALVIIAEGNDAIPSTLAALDQLASAGLVSLLSLHDGHVSLTEAGRIEAQRIRNARAPKGTSP